MFRTLICTAALTIAFTATHAGAGKFKINFGGGGKGTNWNVGNHNNHHNGHHNHYNGHHHNHYHKVYKPVAKCYYQVCFYHASWGYKKHEVFTCLHEAEAFAHKVQHLGYYASISKTCTPYASGHIIYNHGHIHNSWMP